MRSMKKIDGVLTIAAALFVLAGTTGCQSGWKFSNPFSRNPKASSADAPKELDDDFAEIDDITPPPENYTVGDSIPKNEKKSIAQEGKYGDEDESRAVAASDNNASASDDFSTRSYAQTYQTPSPANSFADGVGSSTPYDARQSAGAETLSDTVARLDPAASAAAASQPYVPQNSVAAQSANPGYSANTAYPASPVDQTASFAQSQTPAADSFPSASSSIVGNPIAQVSAAAPTQTYAQSQAQTQVQPQRQPASVALNYDTNAPVAAPNVNPNAPSSTSDDSNPYSGVVYTPQTTSGGFAPGSVLY